MASSMVISSAAATVDSLAELSSEEMIKQIEHLLRSELTPCLEFSQVEFVYREQHKSPGYYDGRWTMWKQPMFGCTDATQLLKELEELKNAYPDAIARITAFNNDRQEQCINFIAYKPPSKEDNP
ncbi:ribulose bisphosphate carboxylase small chain A, chloroplastic-like [Phalaenopsis equestris]|uniref:ribulose bisphosphate carboxylase small chain A, chloroplastic-like n=1 Tax=Phalaenopsis equestris TaxID=78828 RepID=UPI0009E5778A|nr:ribulose bisphosphate carboxylase small chain A, chloroplastic-like [Phalaenopsis equestris]